MVIKVLVAVVCLSCILTLILRRYALSHRIIDVPNERSSHSLPTPRGGGVAIVISYLLSLPVLFANDFITFASLIAYLVSGATVALLGFADDHGHIGARWRLLGHFGAAVWGLYWLHGLPSLALPWGVVDFGVFGQLVALVYLVWMLNLYNFMDGINGLAACEAIFVCLAASFFYWQLDIDSIIWGPLILSSAVIGFLGWNFPVARIFMGDAGSGFLGLMLALFAVQAAWVSPELFWSWIILLGVFVVDATWTLIFRLCRGEKAYQAHRSHAYQVAARFYASHTKVTLAVMIINVLWLLPIASWVAFTNGNGLAGVVLAYFPLCLLAYKFKAGRAG